MLKQPKGLIAAALANTGERFGFYTMMAILTLFLMSKFGIDGEQAGKIYSFFYTSIYILALVGGLIADRLRNYKGTITAGIVIMTLGYAVLMVPTISSKALVIGALMIIAFGNGLFKGNLQALVGQLYDNEQYAKLRDTGFQIFYMFINIGAMVAPFAAVGVRNWWLRTQGYLYNSDLSALCHQYLGGSMAPEVVDGRFSELAAQVSLNGAPTDMGAFAESYLNAFNTGFHYAFGVAIVALLFSLVVFLANKKKLPDPKVAEKNRPTPSKAEIQQDAREIKQRLYALFAVFAIVIFFWFSFHQNGLTLTLFAQDYTRLEIFGMPITAEIFQSANPFCVVFLTPLVIAVFSWLRNRGKEPSTPMKIAIGMGIAAFAYVLMVVGSLGLPKLAEVQAQGGLAVADRVTPWLLVATYLILTVAELFISPLGLSFVSKVAPQKLQGLMQGCWLGATAIGNGLLFIGPILYKRISISATWSIFVIVCAISMIAMLAMVKWLERVTRGHQIPGTTPLAECVGGGVATEAPPSLCRRPEAEAGITRPAAAEKQPAKACPPVTSRVCVTPPTPGAPPRRPAHSRVRGSPRAHTRCSESGRHGRPPPRRAPAAAAQEGRIRTSYRSRDADSPTAPRRGRCPRPRRNASAQREGRPKSPRWSPRHPAPPPRG